MTRFNKIVKIIVAPKCNVRFNSVWSVDKIVRSPYKDVAVPELTVAEYMWQSIEKWPLKTAVVCGITNRSYTYEEMYKKSHILAANLRKKFKIDNGDVISIMSPNIPEFPIATFGILTAGAVVTTLNPVYTAHEVQYQIETTDPKIVIAHVNAVAVVKEALVLSKRRIPIIAFNTDIYLPENTVSFEELVEDNNVDMSILKDVNRKADDIAFLPFSSGTTGLPKGVDLSNKNLVVNCEQQNTELRQYNPTTEHHQDATLAVLPFFHAYGFCLLMLQKLTNGLKIVTLPNFQSNTFADVLARYPINLLYLAPPLVLFMGTSPLINRKHLEHTCTIISGAAPLPKADIEKLLSKTAKNARFQQGYGMTEAGPLVSIPAPECRDYETVGVALPNIHLRIVDEEMRNLGPNERGELLIKGPNIMRGYLKNPKANEESFIDGWYRSGDIGHINEVGNLYITDRLKELIKVKGLQVPPAELESVIKEHPAIHDAAVVGVPDQSTGEKPKAFVVLKPDNNTTEQDIIDFVSRRVASYKNVKEVVFVDIIPKNPSGKILRKLLR